MPLAEELGLGDGQVEIGSPKETSNPEVVGRDALALKLAEDRLPTDHVGGPFVGSVVGVREQVRNRKIRNVLLVELSDEPLLWEVDTQSPGTHQRANRQGSLGQLAICKDTSTQRMFSMMEIIGGNFRINLIFGSFN